MILDHTIGIFTNPDKEWAAIRKQDRSMLAEFLTHVPLLVLIPTICFYYGVSQVGWTATEGGEVIRLSSESAMVLCVLSYGAALVGIWVFGMFINWMAETYSDEKINSHHGMALSVYSTTPIMLAGAAGAFPSIWFNAAAMLVAGAYSVFLIYRGMPILMNIPEERAFMYSSSVITVALVMLVTLRVATVIVWSAGVGPEYVAI
ncbi:Inner membrane protein YohC [Sinobacterium norvegicum]|uniref:Inner membrane protein YohC n=1 Tax=Sinobacterium norvegicum TaxID=1641715 RepID=A0ABM9ADE9_9GAMM|nr:Yip1 family protein [Sinobacterium norvegicum]CAH0990729.1 Inner membrane protein YohC [Sinobacterium norvegicum]